MKPFLLFIFFLTISTGQSSAEIAQFSKDRLLIEKAAKELLGSKVKYELILDKSDNAHVVFKSPKFRITIGEKAYAEYGQDEGGLALTCHELGHAAAGTRDFVSTEEDADYWATNVCMPKMLEYFPNKKSEIVTEFDNDFKKACEKFTDSKKQMTCYRSLRGAFFFREHVYKNYCNSQQLSFKALEKDLSKTPYKGKRPPNMAQCSFNNLVAGTLNLKQPSCTNLMLMAAGFFGQNCSPGSYSQMPQELGVEEDTTIIESSISNVSRSIQIKKNEDVISNEVGTQTNSR